MEFIEHKRNNIHIMGIPEGEKKESWKESIFKAIMTESFPNLRREMEIQIHETQKFPNMWNSGMATLRCIITKL